VLSFLQCRHFFALLIACAIPTPLAIAFDAAPAWSCLQSEGGRGDEWTSASEQNSRAVRIPFKPNFVSGYKFSFSMDTRGVTLPAGFANQIEGAASYMYDMWRQALTTDQLRAAHVNVLLLVDPIDFENLKFHLAPDLPDVTGFYASRDGMAVARYDARDLSQSRRSAIHEISHLLTTSQIGPTDVWLAEGLAEYFETITVAGGTGTVSVNDRHLHLLDVESMPALTDFVSMPVSEWKKPYSLRYYSIAWSVVYFLMDSEEGKAALGRFLREVYIRACAPYSTVELLEKAYYGGLRQLDVDWRHWLRGQQFRPHKLITQS